jgi:excisionase family DNA binding protein
VTRLLTMDEVSAMLGIPVASLRFWRVRGTGPASIKVGRHVRYRQADIDAWLEQNTTPAA